VCLHALSGFIRRGLMRFERVLSPRSILPGKCDCAIISVNKFPDHRFIESILKLNCCAQNISNGAEKSHTALYIGAQFFLHFKEK
jgi:hypothetical protein